MRSFDLVVVGAGIASGSLVYNLLKQGFRGSILVVEKGDAVATGSTAYSAGGFRNLWTTAINQQLCTKGMEVIKNFQGEMGASIGYDPCGYLFVYYEDAWKQIPKAAEIWKENKVNFDLFTPEQIEACIPGLKCGVDHIDPEVAEFLEMQPIVGGVMGYDCGSFDPSQAAPIYFDRAGKDFPVKPVLQLNTEAQTVIFDGKGRATGVTIKDASGAVETVQAGMVALCCGAWTNGLLRRSGCPESDMMPIIAQKRMLFVTDFPGHPNEDPRWHKIPLTTIDKGIYFKYESGNLLIGRAKDDTPDSFDTTFEPDYYVNEINLIMQERIPSTSVCKMKSGWAGLYDTNTADHNAIVGWHDEHPQLLLQVGYSGHGAMESPAVGICLAELVLTGKFQTVDCTPLRWSRFREGDLVHEKIVI